MTSILFREILALKELIIQLGSNDKTLLTLNEAARYLGLSSSTLYKFSSKRIIRTYCPNGKKIFFKKSDLDEFLLRNPRKSISEIKGGMSNGQ